jgi:4-alpha-glucanotransferase
MATNSWAPLAFERMSGILLHPTSLAGPYGMGEIGQAAFDFIDDLAQAGQRLWQILPIPIRPPPPLPPTP